MGSKDDQRGAEAEVVINKKRQRVQAGGYSGFRWQRVKLPEGVTGGKYDLALQAPRRIREGILSSSTPGEGRVYNNHRCEPASAQGSGQVGNVDWLPTASQLPFFRDESLEG